MARFTDLPPKVLTNIIVALPTFDILAVKQVNRTLHTFIRDSVDILYAFCLKTCGLLDNPGCALSVDEKRRFGAMKENNWNFFKIAVERDFPVSCGALEEGICAVTSTQLFVGTYKVDDSDEDEENVGADVDAVVNAPICGVQHVPMPTIHNIDDTKRWSSIELHSPIVGFAESVDENDLFLFATYKTDEEDSSFFSIDIGLVQASTNRPHGEAESSVLTVESVLKGDGPPRVGLAIAGENLAIAIMAHPEGRSNRDSLTIWDWKSGVQKHTQRFRATDLGMTFLREDILVVCNSIRGSLDFYQIPLSSEIDLNPSEPTRSNPNDPLQTTPLYLPPIRVRVISGLALPELNTGWTLSSIGCSSSPAPTPGLTFPKALEKLGKQPFAVDPEKAVVVFVVNAVTEDDPGDRHTFHMVVHRQALVELLPKEKFTELEEVVGRLEERRRRRGDVDALAAVGLEEEEEDYQTNPYYTLVGWEMWGMDVTRWFDMDGFADVLGTVAAGQKYVRFELEGQDEEDEETEDGGDEDEDVDDEDEDEHGEEEVDEADEEGKDEDDDEDNEQGEDDGDCDDPEHDEEREAGEKEVAQPSTGKLHILDFNPYNVKRAFHGLGGPGPFPGPDCTLTVVGRMSSLDDSDTPRVNDDGTSWEGAENVCADHGVFSVLLIGRLPYTSVVGNESYGFDGVMVCEHSVVGIRSRRVVLHIRTTDAMVPSSTVHTPPKGSSHSPIQNRQHQSPRSEHQITGHPEHLLNQGSSTTKSATQPIASGGIQTSATPTTTDPLLPPEWITSPQDNSTPIRTFVGFMQRQLSGLVGPRSGIEDIEEVDEDDQAPVDSPRLRRAGLLQSRSYNAPSLNPSSYTSAHNFGLPSSQTQRPALPRPPLLRRGSSHASSAATELNNFHPHSPKSIRATTLQLSNMSMCLPSSMPPYDPSEPTPMSDPLLEARHDDPDDFIFPQSATSMVDETSIERTPRLKGTMALPTPSSELSLPLNLPMESDHRSLTRSSTMTTTTDSDGKAQGSRSATLGTMTDSIGTLLSFASLSEPPAPEAHEDPRHARTESKKKSKQKKLSGLSLSKPASSGYGSGSGSSDSSRASSVDSRQPNASTRPPLRPLYSRSPSSHPSGNGEEGTPTATPLATPKAMVHSVPLPLDRPFGGLESDLPYEDATPGHPRVRWLSPLRSERRPEDGGNADERTPLLRAPEYRPDPDVNAVYHNDNEDRSGPIDVEGGGTAHLKKLPSITSLALKRLRFSRTELKRRIRREVSNVPTYSGMAIKAIPAVLLGSLLNILDGVSYGMIMFPAAGVFADLGPMGVSMFFVSTIVAQLVYTCGGSGFAGGNGSMMIEVVPFFHILANSIANQVGEDDPAAVIATTLVAYAFSSLLTGLCFFLLGALKLGVLIGFFPRHILVGCIGGVGVFLVETGLTASMRIDDDDFDYNLETLKLMFEAHNLILWALPLTLAIMLRVITHKFHHQLILPIYFLIIPLVFYVVVWSAGLNLAELRSSGWIFDIGSSVHEPWHKFYSYFDFGKVHYNALWATLPTQFALLFFNILHPPLNVPALAVSLDNDVDTNKELVAHGYSNLLSGVIGSVPNYLVYVNTLLFYRVGGDNRIAGFLLAIATGALLIIGTGPIAYLPVMVVGALIFVLGIDLVKEALWDNRHRVSWSEYVTIASIMVVMTLWDFVIGVLFGIIISCFFFVIQNSRLRSIRAMYTGDLAMSAVRRPSLQRAYIREVSKQTTILRLQGFLFFGTITYVEETIRSLIEGPYWHQHPVRFLVLDLSLVAGVDMSSAEAFVRIQRLLSARYVTLVFCGFDTDSSVGNALRSVDLFDTPGVELFSTFSDAIEWTENAYLRAWLKSQKIETSFLAVPGRRDADVSFDAMVGSFVRSPRRSHIRDVGERTIAAETLMYPGPDLMDEPLNTLRKAFSSYGTVDPVLFQPISNYMERVTSPSGAILWRQGESPNGLYVIESGVLRASYTFANPSQHFEESMVAGTLAGELSALAEAPRNATVVVEHGPAVMWRLDGSNLKRLQLEQPELARVFIQLVLKAAKLDYDILLSAIASRQ